MYNWIEIFSQTELDNWMIEIHWVNGWIYIIYPEELNG